MTSLHSGGGGKVFFPDAGRTKGGKDENIESESGSGESEEVNSGSVEEGSGFNAFKYAQFSMFKTKLDSVSVFPFFI